MPRKMKNKGAKPLLDDGEEAPAGLSINKAFAAKFVEKKKTEDLTNVKHQQLLAEEEEDDSTSETEDEEAEALTKSVAKGFLRTLSLLKAKDPKIYNKDVPLYNENEEEDEEDGKAEKPKKEKPMYLKDHERMRILTKGENAFVSDDDESGTEQPNKDETYVEQQKRLKSAFLQSVEDEDDDLLKPRSKTAEEEEHEQADYERWLQEEAPDLDPETKEDLQPLRRFWNDPNLSEDDKFLRDYILKQGWKDESAPKQGKAPSYKEIVASESSEDELEKAEEFERKYNFRFEEEGGDQIMSYPRDISTSVRKQDDRRKTERERKEERKEQERKQKEEEIKRLKNLKREEIMNKLRQIQEASGTNLKNIEALDLEGEFDPETYDKQLQAVFDEEFYQEDANDDVKPTWDDDLGEEYLPEDERMGYEDDYAPHVEDEDFNMDADFVPMAKESKKDKKKKKGKKDKDGEGDEGAGAASGEVSGDPSKEDEALMAEFAKTHGKKTLEQYLEELYNLDYEDIVGGIPTRFKYREVEANDFGLSTEEVLQADEKELNKWVSVKKMSQYRAKEDEERDKARFSRRTFDLPKKREAFPSLLRFYKDCEKAEKRKRRERKEKKRKRKEAAKASGADVSSSSSSSSESAASSSEDEAEEKEQKKDKKKEDKKSKGEDSKATKMDVDGAAEPGEGDGEGKKKKKKKNKKSKLDTSAAEGEGEAEAAPAAVSADGEGKKKKKKDKKDKDGKAKGAEPSAVENIPNARLALYKSLQKKKKETKDEDE